KACWTATSIPSWKPRLPHDWTVAASAPTHVMPAEVDLDPDERKARQQKRQAARGRVFDTSIPSPSSQTCQIDRNSTHCIGCLRTLDEIRDWPIMTAEEKQAVLDRLAALEAGDRGAEDQEQGA